MKERGTGETIMICVPGVGGDEVGQAIDLVEHLVEKYHISQVDADALFNSMVAIYVRQRAVYGDRQPATCSHTECLEEVKS